MAEIKKTKVNPSGNESAEKAAAAEQKKPAEKKIISETVKNMDASTAEPAEPAKAEKPAEAEKPVKAEKPAEVVKPTAPEKAVEMAEADSRDSITESEKTETVHIEESDKTPVKADEPDALCFVHAHFDARRLERPKRRVSPELPSLPHGIDLAAGGIEIQVYRLLVLCTFAEHCRDWQQQF